MIQILEFLLSLIRWYYAKPIKMTRYLNALVRQIVNATSIYHYSSNKPSKTLL